MQNIVFWIAACIVITSAMGSLASVVLFLAKLRIPTSGLVAGIVLILPATGSLDNLENLLAALGRQSVRARRLIIAVESPDDPAYRRATELAKTHREPVIDVVVAGVSNRRGQKCTNILAALTRLAAEDRFVVMLDDHPEIIARPQGEAANRCDGGIGCQAQADALGERCDA